MKNSDYFPLAPKVQPAKAILVGTVLSVIFGFFLQLLLAVLFAYSEGLDFSSKNIEIHVATDHLYLILSVIVHCAWCAISGFAATSYTPGREIEFGRKLAYITWIYIALMMARTIIHHTFDFYPIWYFPVLFSMALSFFPAGAIHRYMP
ncbi:hypothetical protein ACO0LD_05240 [Undibacterium sp. Ji83W]|uniref:hypothetical protein n=1 Tax=Undibacterium sp. Ji83W TaxID=3413043 RepID=UPI003BF38FE5